MNTINSADDAKHFVKYGTESVGIVVSMDRWNVDRFQVGIASLIDVLGIDGVDVVLLHFVRSVLVLVLVLVSL